MIQASAAFSGILSVFLWAGDFACRRSPFGGERTSHRSRLSGPLIGKTGFHTGSRISFIEEFV